MRNWVTPTILKNILYYLIKNPITNQEPCISPTCSISLSNCLQSQVEPCCTFLKGDHVYKLYDTEVDSTNIFPLSPIWRRKKYPRLPSAEKNTLLWHNREQSKKSSESFCSKAAAAAKYAVSISYCTQRGHR